MTYIAVFALPVIVALVATLADITPALGAHPWWGIKVIWIGLPIGLILAVSAWATGWGRRPRLIGFGALTLAAFGLAHFGKTRFAASYAEDALAGQIWYFGWIATCALMAAMLASLAAPNRQAH